MGMIHERIWANEKSIIEKVENKEGEVEDLTKTFYCADNNLHDEHYYENIGNCMQLHRVFQHLQLKINCI